MGIIMDNIKNDLLENKNKNEFKSNSLPLNTDEAISYNESTDIVFIKKNLVFENNIYKKTDNDQLELFINPLKKNVNANINPIIENDFVIPTNVELTNNDIVDLTHDNLAYEKSFIISKNLNSGDKVRINFQKPTKSSTMEKNTVDALVAKNNTQFSENVLGNEAVLLGVDNFIESVESGNFSIYHDSYDIRIHFKILGDNNNIGLYFDF